MSTTRFALFATAIGECALAWNDVGLVGSWLPEPGSGGGLRRKVERRHPDAVESPATGAIAEAVASIRRLMDGEPVDLRSVALDWGVVPAAARRVYELAREIAPGRVTTYGALAGQLGDVDARSVGQTLGANPFPIVVPCHRVIAADGRLGGFSGPGGASQKQRLLAIEQARPDGPPGLFDVPMDGPREGSRGDLSPPAESASAPAPTRSPAR